MPAKSTKRLAAGGCAIAAAVLAGCGSNGSKAPPVVTVTVPPSPAGTPSTTASAAPSRSASPSPSAAVTKIRGTCETLLPDYTVSHELGGITLSGRTAYVVGVPDPGLGRLATVNCRYGVTGSGAAAKAKVEIGVSLYRTPEAAATRVTATADDYRAHGGAAADMTVRPSGRPAATGTYLSGGTGAGYEFPLLVVASGQRTVAVTVDPAAVRSLGADKAAVTLAGLALQRTAS